MNPLDTIRDFFDPQDAQPENIRNSPDARFILKEQQQVGAMILYVITDRETGVSYLTKPGNTCPFTPLLDADGRPLID